MSNPVAPAAAPERERPSLPADDVLTICAISVLAAILANILHEGVGHGLIALLSGADSGLLTTVAWSSAFESRLVEAGGTLANLAAGLIFWFWLGSARGASMPTRYFLLIGCAFNLLSGTGYFFFSGVTDFGDWASVISGLYPHWLWRVLLVAVGAASYYAAVRVIGVSLVRCVGVPLEQPRRLRRLTTLPYVSAILLLSLAALLNPFRNSAAVAVRPACDRWWSERLAVVAILYSASHGAATKARTAQPQLCVGGGGGCFGISLCCGSGAGNNAPPRKVAESVGGSNVKTNPL